MPRSYFFARRFRKPRYSHASHRYKRRKTGYSTEFRNFSRQSFHRYPNELSTRVAGARTIPAALGAYPKAIRVCLPFTETAQLTTVAGVGCWYRWRGNSVYDPDLTGGGTQPFGFDQWTNFYNYWVVTGSSFELTAVNTTNGITADQACLKLVLVPTSSTAVSITSTALDNAEEFPDARYRLLSSSAAYGMQENTIRHYMTTAKVEGVSPSTVMSSHFYQGTTSSDPSLSWLWNVGVNNMLENGSTTYTVHVKIRYYVVFSNPKLVTGS